MSGRLPLVDAEAPPERLAAFRIVVGVFTVGYLLIRLPVFSQLAHRSGGFDGVGVFAATDGPLPAAVVRALIAGALVAGAAFTAGAWYRVSGPAFALLMLALSSYRSSWGQLLHFENLFVLYLLLLALTPAADAWSLDAARRSADGRPSPDRPATSYGWPLRLAAMTLVTTYVIAGIAKLRYGGIEWITGDTLRNHIAYSAVRLDVLGADAAPLALLAVEQDWILPPMALGSVVIELAAPVALLGGLYRNAWVVAAWLMHFAIFVTMLVGFPAPLFLVAFTPLFDLERGGRALLARVARVRSVHDAEPA